MPSADGRHRAPRGRLLPGSPRRPCPGATGALGLRRQRLMGRLHRRARRRLDLLHVQPEARTRTPSRRRSPAGVSTLSRRGARRRGAFCLRREGLARATSGRGLRPGDGCNLSLGGGEVDATAAVRHRARTIAFVVPAWNDALLFVEREGLKETHHMGVWLSLYAVPDTTMAPLRQGMADLRSALSVPES